MSMIWRRTSNAKYQIGITSLAEDTTSIKRRSVSLRDKQAWAVKSVWQPFTLLTDLLDIMVGVQDCQPEGKGASPPDTKSISSTLHRQVYPNHLLEGHLRKG